MNEPNFVDGTKVVPGDGPLGLTESMFRLLFERSGDAMSLFDPETGRFVESNAAAVLQVKAPDSEAMKNLSPIEISPERQADGKLSADKALEMIAQALRNGSHRFEWLARRYDGTELPLDVVLTAFPYNGRAMLLVVSRDISAQKQAEQENHRLNSVLEQRVAERTAQLMETNEQLRAEMHERQRSEENQRRRNEQTQRHRDVLLDLARSPKFDLPIALEKICSQAASTLEVERVSYWSLVDDESAIVCELLYRRELKGPDERVKGARLAAADTPAYFAALGTKRLITANDVFSHPATKALGDSYLKPLGITSMLDAPVWVRGEVVGVLCHEHIGNPREWTVEEVDFASSVAAFVSQALEESRRAQSEARLRESEARFSAAFQASPVFITISCIEQGRYVLANEAFLKWTGYRLDEVLGRNSAELSLWADPADRQPFWDELRRTGSIRERECRVQSRHGRLYTMLLSSDIIEINSTPHLLTVGLDITQRKLAEMELLKTLAREKELGQLRTNFVSMVSHEFRTPLGVIHSSAEILQDYFEQLNAAERHEHLQSIQKNTRRMAGLMEEVLLLGGFYSDKVEFKPTMLDLKDFIRRLVDEIHSATNRRSPIELKLGDLPNQAKSDERLLRHIISNLLTNAVKYSQPGQPVELAIERQGLNAVFVIRDQGIGIPESDREWLFTAFHRGQNVGDRPGTGLGLVIVKHCVNAHGGRINIQSTFGQGTVATVHLPLFVPVTASQSTSHPTTGTDTAFSVR